MRQLAMQAIADTRFVPEKGRNRLGSMVEGRPDWVISRQRAWGVPIALFVERKTGELLVDREVNARIVAAFREQGVDAWDAANAAAFLGNRNPDDYEMVTDILDVWFDSGCTHVFTLESGHWPDERWPADLYLEGSDQHRGWFQSSLLESCGTRGRAPYDAVLTHGFTMDAKGMKMSKSLGNTVSPIDLMKEYGADILRLWALSVDFTEDHRIGKEILAGVADQYRKLRNTFRYLLGALEGFSDEERLEDVAAYPELERYMLHLTAELDAKLRQAVNDFDFNTYVRALTDFCNEDLSRLLLRYPQGRALLRGEPASGSRPTSAAPTGRCSTPCSTRWCGGSRRCWCSPAKKCGARAIPTPGLCTCSNGRRSSVRTVDCRMRQIGRFCASTRATSHRSDRAAAPRKVIGSSLEAEATVSELPRRRRGSRRAVHHLDSPEGRYSKRGQDR